MTIQKRLFLSNLLMLVIPALLAVLCLGAIELLTILYFLVFLLLTPPPCLPAEPWRQLLCALGGGRI